MENYITVKNPLRTGAPACQCGGCGEYFKNVETFELHRSGKAGARECLDPVTKKKRGGKPKFVWDADKGYWIKG